MSQTLGAQADTVEDRLRAAHGVLFLLADLYDLQAVAPDYARGGWSPAACEALGRLCRQHGRRVEQLAASLPADVMNASVKTRRRRRAKKTSEDTEPERS